MFDNLKIGKKMLLLSGTILSLLLIVLMFGIRGMSNTVKSGQEVATGNELNGNLAQLEIDHLNWAGNVAAFLNDDSVDELNVQMDHKECDFGKWYYGEGRKHAEQILPAMHADLEALDGPHAKLHASARKIKNVYQSADAKLPQFLTEKELDHMSWAFKIQEAIIAHSSRLDLEFDHKQCGLGKFLYGEEGRVAAAKNPELAKIFADIKGPHEKLHQHGKKIDNLLRAGNFTVATNYFAAEVTPTLHKVSSLVKASEQVATDALIGQQQATQIYLTESQPNLREVQKYLSNVRGQVSTQAGILAASSASAVKVQTWIVVSIGFAALLVGCVIAVLISRSLTGPMRQTVDMLEELEKGHLDNRLNLSRKDEIGDMAESMDRFADSLQGEVVNSLEMLANGDLTFNVSPRDEQDVLRGSLKKLGADLNNIMGQILTSGNEISSAASQVADSSQSLSQGATEQAASLEEISASLNETSSQISLTAENSAKANRLANQTKEAAENGSGQMQTMVSAMAEINEAGQNISKIIKTIDEIAFQTNLLALNAAVEAARAGQHGKGFAVVAEEVRNLAARSAKAAAETAELIEGSVEKTENGSVIAIKTSEALQDIVSGVGQVTELVAEIAAASTEQAEGVSEINQGIAQIDTVTQQNTANSEESAAAAEEMSGQAAQLRQMLQHFTLLQSGQESKVMLSEPQAVNGWPEMEPSRTVRPRQARPANSGRRAGKENPKQALGDSEFGRY